MIEGWLKPLEHLALVARQHDKRVIGITSAHEDAGVNLISSIFAEVLLRSGVKVLLVDAHNAIGGADGVDEGVLGWRPGAGNAEELIEAGEAGFDVLKCRVNEETRFLFNDSGVLRNCFGAELANYGAIVVAMPPVDLRADSVINPAGLAGACDEVLFVCVNGGSGREAIAQACAVLRARDVSLGGLIFNSGTVEPVGEQLARAVGRYLFWIPPVRRWLSRKAMESHLLNS